LLTEDFRPMTTRVAISTVTESNGISNLNVKLPIEKMVDRQRSGMPK